MVECEYRCGYMSLTYLTVLIDTWWNVNIRLHPFLSTHRQVLIDTWWNVNYVSFQLYLPRIGF